MSHLRSTGLPIWGRRSGKRYFNRSKSVDLRVPRERSEAGDTLIEVLVAIVIVALAGVSLLGAFGLSIAGSAVHRGLTTIDTVLKSFAENATYQIQLQQSPLFGACATMPGTASSAGTSVSYVVGAVSTPLNNYVPPANFTVTVTSIKSWNSNVAGFVQYWDGSTNNGTCVASPPVPQLITATATGPGPVGKTVSDSYSFVVQDPGNHGYFAAGAATKLVFLQSTTNQAAGLSFSTSPVVAVEDANGNIVTGDTSPITLNITSGTGTSGATLAGCAGSILAGITTFGGCRISTIGTGYTLTATDGSLTSSISTAFDITSHAASQLVFLQWPQSGTGGTAFGVQAIVAVEDASGNIISADASNVTLGITAGSGSTGAAMTGCSSTNSGGVTTYAGCKIDKSGSSYSLTATDGALIAAVSPAFDITAGPASQVVFTQSPSSTTAGVAFASQPTVAVKDAGGNVVTTDTSTPSLNITAGTGTAGASLSCGTPSVSAGVTTFVGCNVNKTGSNYTLTATDGTLTSSVSNSFNISPNAATQLVFTGQPGGGPAGAVWSNANQPSVTIEDAYGNVATTNSSSVSLTIASGTGTAGAVLSGCSAATSGGVANFAGCSIDKSGSSYTLTATDGSLTSAISSPFNIGAVAPTVSSISPSSDPKGTTVTVTITGSNFVNGAGLAVAFTGGPGSISVNSVTYVNSTTLTASIKPGSSNGTKGTYSVKVTNPNGQSGTGVGLFTVT
jgi:type II secretory pathway pseudopilin PulG